MSRYDAVVIGGGINGLVAAAVLHQRGRRVAVIEERADLGGLGARHPFGRGAAVPGLLHDLSLLQDIIVRDLDLERFGLRRRTPPAILCLEAGGLGVVIPENADGPLDDVRARFPRSAEGLARWRGFIDRVGPVVRSVLSRPPPHLGESPARLLIPALRAGRALRRLGRRDMMDLLRVPPMSVQDWMDDYIPDAPLAANLAAPALHGGSLGPRAAGTAAALLMRACGARLEPALGAAALVEALVGLCREHRITMRTDAAVHRVNTKGDVVLGVALTTGEEIHSDVVVATCDPRRLVLDLIDPRVVPQTWAHDLMHYRGRGHAAKVHLQLDRPLAFKNRPGQRVERARTGESLDVLERTFDALKYDERAEPPVPPLLDIHVPTVSDPTLAPSGHEVVSILVDGVPHRPTWTEDARAALGDAVIAELRRHAVVAPEAIVAREVLTPADLTASFGLVEGHLHHGEMTLDQLAFMRPSPHSGAYATPIRGLWIGGRGAHPGGPFEGLPGYLAGHAARR
jgi:phytoene dehydrogenase-like protein